MTSYHVITFYSIERIENNKKLGRVVERFCIKNKIVGTFFSTPQGVNTTLSGTKKPLEELIILLEIKLETSFDISVIWFVSPSYPCVDGLFLLQAQFVSVSEQT